MNISSATKHMHPNATNTIIIHTDMLFDFVGVRSTEREFVG